MRNTIFTLGFVLSALSASATSISLSGSSIFESDGTTLLGTGSYTSIGYFDSGFSDFSGLTSRDWSEVISSGDYVEAFNSALSGEGEATGFQAVTGIQNEELYVWFFDSIGAPISSVSTQEFGLFTGSSAEWTAKGDTFSDFNTLEISSITSAVFGSDLGSNVSLQAVPEPSTYAALSGLLALSWVMVRRRRA